MGFPIFSWSFQLHRNWYAIEVLDAGCGTFGNQHLITKLFIQPTSNRRKCLRQIVTADQIELFLPATLKSATVCSLSLTHSQRPWRGVAAARTRWLWLGADRIESTLLGNGERTGNMDIRHNGMNIYSQGHWPTLALGDMDADHKCGFKACTLFTSFTRAAPTRTPGELVFTAFSGFTKMPLKNAWRIKLTPNLGNVAYLPIWILASGS